MFLEKNNYKVQINSLSEYSYTSARKYVYTANTAMHKASTVFHRDLYIFHVLFLVSRERRAPSIVHWKLVKDNSYDVSAGILNIRHMIKCEFVFKGRIKLVFVFISFYPWLEGTWFKSMCMHIFMYMHMCFICYPVVKWKIQCIWLLDHWAHTWDI